MDELDDTPAGARKFFKFGKKDKKKGKKYYNTVNYYYADKGYGGGYGGGGYGGGYGNGKKRTWTWTWQN